MDFVHLHVHSHYSQQDGVAGVRDLVQRASELGMRALALTDHNTLAGIVPFCETCRELHVQPVIGCELGVVPFNSRISVEATYGLVVLVETETGYRNLVSLVNRAHANAKHGTPFLRFDELSGKTTGLVALTGGVSSELFHLMLNGRTEDTEGYMNQLARVFGKEDIVFEIQDFGLPRQKQLADRIHSLSDYLGMRCVATNDVHYLRPEDSICSEFLKQERPPTFLDFTALKSGAHTHHFATAQEMSSRFARFPRTIFSTCEIAERCAFQPNFDKRRFPVHDFVRGFDADSFLWDLAFREARARFAELTNEMKDRLNQEFDYIKREGLSNNILLLWNAAQFCRKSKIHLGVGRGDMISSLVAYILGISQVNPLEYKMLFLGFGESGNTDRCLNLEIPAKHARAVHDFLRETFGADFCSAVGKYPWYQRNSLVREVCAWFNMPHSQFEQTTTQEHKSVARDADIREFFPKKIDGVALPNPEIVNYVVSRLMPRPRGLTQLENQYAISGENLNHLVPRVMIDEEPVTQMDASALDSLNVPRLSIQFNTMLNVLDAAAGWVRKEENASFDPDRIEFDDDDTYDLLSKGLTNGIDPFNSITLKSLLREHRPRNFMGLLKIKSMEDTPNREQDKDVRENVPDCILTYKCAFIKAHYPISFMAALLTHTYRNRKKFTIVLREAKHMGLRVLPPDINLSVFEFSQVHKSIRTGLMVVSGMGQKAYAELARVRRGGDFNDLMDLCRRTDSRLVNNRLLGNLVKTGALDCFGLKRSQMLQMLENEAELARREAANATFFDQGAERAVLEDEPPEMPELPLAETIRHEIAAAGYCISFDQLHLYQDLVRKCRAISPYDLGARHVGREVYVVGFLEHVESNSPLIDENETLLLDLEGRVVTMPAKAGKLYAQALNASAPVLVGGVVHRRKDEVYVKAITAFTMRMVQQMGRLVNQLDLELSGENARTLRMIRSLVGLYRGGTTKVAVHNYNGSAWSRRHIRSIEKTPVYFCPPFYYALKKILSEDRIVLMAAEEMDADLLHALSPQRFPRSAQAVKQGDETEDNSSVADVY